MTAHTTPASITERAEALVSQWPPLSDEQLDRIAGLLRSGSKPAAAETVREAS